MPSGRIQYVTKPVPANDYRVDRRATYNMPLASVKVDILGGPESNVVTSGVRCNNDIFPTPSGA